MKEEKLQKQSIEAFTEIVDGKMIAIASDDSIDRMGDSLEIDRWELKNFKKNPILLAGHQNFPEYVVGVAKNIKTEGNKLIFEPIFHGITELSKNLEKMVTEGFIKAWSVGFIPNALMEKDNKNARNELLEISLVAVPANANALMVSAKSYGDSVKKEVEEWVDKSVEVKEEVADKKAQELVNKIVEEKGKKLSKEIDAVELKEGKVISKANRFKINSAVEQIKQTVVVLEKILDLSDTPKEEPKEITEIKVEQTKSVKKMPVSEKEMTVQILKKIAGKTNLALNKLNRK